LIGAIILGSKPNMKMAKKYKKLIGFFIGNTPAVAITDFSLAKELFNRAEWCGRHNSIVSRYFRSDSGKSKGIIMTDGQEWTDIRRFTLKHLKDFGFGRAGLEEVIQGEVEDLINLFALHNGNDFRMETVFGIPVINVLWTIVAGQRFNFKDPKAQRLMELLNRTFKSKFALQYALPWWGIVASLMPGLNARVKIIRELRAMFRESIEEHRSTRDANQPRDFLDVFLAEVEKGENPTFDQESLELTCLDLFKAGAETTSTTLLWCILYLTRYKEVQEAAREEVERETGEERPSLKHQLPYCQAVIQEVQRLSCVAPQTIPHRVTAEQALEGFVVPKNSHAIANLTKFMKDPEYWEQPNEFRPQRFLELFEGRWRLVKKEQFVPFGFGRRVCMGESLARDNLFIFLSTLIKHIRFENPVGHRKPDPGNHTDGLTVIPHPYHVNIQLIKKI